MANDILKKVFGQIDTKENFNQVRISIASPEEILSWSKGEVKKPETINYNSMRPEAEGLFCQKTFGPVRDFECACGKYKRVKFRGLVCERCGVEVTDSKVRRERMGHIKLAIPVSHTWFLREGKIAALLNSMPQKKLESVIYYDAYIVIEPGITSLKMYDVISEEEYQAALMEFGEGNFKVGIGAEGIRSIISAMDMGSERRRLRTELAESKSATKRRAILKHLKLVESFLDSGSRPEWMMPDVLPVIPPDMRPLVTLEAGHVATSDLNDLYRRVIIRNNRLKKLQDLHAPEIIIRNEKRMLQESVDALFDNGHKARPLVSQNRRPLKSLSDSLRGKSGRFRMNMLGKRVDYSGRSVIVSGPTLKLHEVGIPKTMALELFKPFVFARLMAADYANTVKAARKMVENGEPVVWDMLEKVVYQHPVLLNRAPTLHRLGILAFDPVLIEGKAIRLHPLVCSGFNADFDGDQMAVYVPISLEAQLEARTLMLSTNNVLSPASGKPIIVPSQDMILGCYYISLMNGQVDEKSPRFADLDEIKLALHNRIITLHTPIVTRWEGERVNTTAGRMILGDLLPKKEGVKFDWVNRAMDKKSIENLLMEVYETCGDKDMIVLADQLKNTGFEYGARSGISIGQDDIIIPSEKADLIKRAKKDEAEIEQQYQNGLLAHSERYNKLIDMWGKVSGKVGDISFENMKKSQAGDNWNSILLMADSGARGSKTQIQQLAGMRGMMTKPDGSIIEVPIISNFKEGLTMAEYFNSTHGTRKGMSDTALKTASAGYLTRRLVELAQNSIITESDCESTDGVTVKPVYNGSNLVVSLGTIVFGRTAAEDIVHPFTKEVIVKAGDLITRAASKSIDDAGIASVEIRSVLTCKSDGLCAKCYGMDLSRSSLVHVGEAVGVIAGQSVGEPGTQLTLRTFHMGGIASAAGDSHFIEAPVAGRVRFDANIIKNSAGRHMVLSKKAIAKIVDDNDETLFETKLPYASMLVVPDGDMIQKGGKLVEWDPYANVIVAETDGKVQFNDLVENLSYSEEVDPMTGITTRKITNWKQATKKPLNPKIILTDAAGKPISLGSKKIAEYMLPIHTMLTVGNGADVKAGDVIARIPVETQKTKDITGGLPQVEALLEVRQPKNPAILAEIDGEVEFEDTAKQKIILRLLPENGDPVEYAIPKGTNILARAGDVVKKGDYLVDGEPILQDILRIQGERVLAETLVEKVQSVYRLQGVTINNKHIEILIREMLRRVEVMDAGDTRFLTGQIIDKIDFEEENARVKKNAGTPAEASQILVGLTRASLTSRSFLSNASFQQTTRVLVDAAINGAVDKLSGINENLIVGRLIPAGTGAYVNRIRQIAKDEEQAEQMAIENASGVQQTMDI